MAKPRVKKNKKAISTFIATLLLMVLAVSAGVVIYAYVMGYLGGFTGTSQTMGAMSIDSASLSTTIMNAYIRNIGHTAINFDKAYVDGAMVNFTAAPDLLLEGQVAKITITRGFAAAHTCEFRLIAEDNTQITFNLKAGGTSTPGGPGTYALTVTPPVGGSVTLDPAGGSYASGTNVTLTAVPDASTFTAWGGALGGSTNPTTITMDGDKSVTATFKRYYKILTIQESQIPGSTALASFPVLVSRTTDAELALRSRADGYDIYFTFDAAGDPATRLDHEIETFNEGTGNLVAWVEIPSLSATSNTVLYMFYGAQSISAPTQNAAGVWDSNYKGVWHLSNGITLLASDSTSNNNDGSITEAVATAGKMDGAGSFDGTNDKIDYGDINSLDGLTTLTVSAWIYPTDLTRDNQHFIAKRPANAATGWGFQTNGVGAGTNVLALIDGGSAAYGVTTGNIVAPNTWTYVSLVYDGSLTGNANRLKIYINGAPQSLSFYSTIPASITANTQTVTLGYSSDSNDKYWKGNIDEARTSNIARSADWIQTEYNNMNNLLTFITVGLETSVP